MRIGRFHLLVDIIALINGVVDMILVSTGLVVVGTVGIGTRRGGNDRFFNAVFVVPFLVEGTRRNGILLVVSVEFTVVVGVISRAGGRALVGQSLSSSTEERMFSVVRSVFDLESIGSDHILSILVEVM
jgi:hypothetical protein